MNTSDQARALVALLDAVRAVPGAYVGNRVPTFAEMVAAQKAIVLAEGVVHDALAEFIAARQAAAEIAAAREHAA